MPAESSPRDAVEVAVQIAAALEGEDCEYAIGGAIALGFWAEPRGTLDVNVTIYSDPQFSETCEAILRRIGCIFEQRVALSSLSEHGYCRVEFHGWRVVVFVPLADFYEVARRRRRLVPLGDSQVHIGDAETLCVFKMMFFRRKDLADVEQLLRSQGEQLDAHWVEHQIAAMYGKRDPRLNTWREILVEVHSDEA